MPANIGKKSYRVGHRHPVTIVMVTLRIVLIFFECVLQQCIRLAYSVVL